MTAQIEESKKKARKQRRRVRHLLKVAKGGFVPADGLTESRLRSKKYKLGDLVLADLTRPRNPGFHRLAHRLGQLIAENIESFAGLDAHKCLKRLQWESGIGCETMAAMIPNVGTVEIRIPLSLAFDSMDQDEFRQVIAGLCNHVAAQYWPGMTADQVAEMAEVMPFD